MTVEQSSLGPLMYEGGSGDLVCKHCGSGDFYADVTVSGWIDGDVVIGDDGRPRFDSQGHVEVDSYERDIDQYVCNACRRSASRLTDLVVRAPGESKPIAPCGRCDHGRHEHPERMSKRNRDMGYTRGPMPCTHDGCDCHDYYDRELAEHGQSAKAA